MTGNYVIGDHIGGDDVMSGQKTRDGSCSNEQQDSGTASADAKRLMLCMERAYISGSGGSLKIQRNEGGWADKLSCTTNFVSTEISGLGSDSMRVILSQGSVNCRFMWSVSEAKVI